MKAIVLLFVLVVSNYFVAVHGAVKKAPEAPQATLPGLNALVTQSGLNYLTKVALSILQTKLQTITIPDQSGDKDSISWQITDIVVTDVVIPAGSITIDTSVGVVVAISDVSGTLTANWHGREDVWPHPSASGSALVNIAQLTIDAVIQVYDSNSRLAVSAQSVSTSIGSLDLHFSGSNLDIILNLLKDLFSNQIKDAVQNAITTAVTNEINSDLNSELATLPVTVPIGTVAYLDYALVSSPYFASSFFSVPLKSEFFDAANPVEAPFTPTSLPNSMGTSEMVQAYISQYVPNTASYAFWKAGKMNLQAVNSEIPPSSPIDLNTSSWQGIVPQLYTMYPNWLMTAFFSPAQTPTVTFTATEITAFGVGTIEMYVISPTNGSLIPAFVLGMNVTADGTVAVRANNITGNLTYISSGVWLQKSYIGPFDPTNLEAIIKFATLVIILPYFNYYLQTGIPIPTVDHVDFVSPTVYLGNGYIYVSTSIQYNP